MLTSFTTVVAFLAILVIYEVASAVITSVRSVQVLNRGGPWRMQQKSLTFLVLRDGARLLYFLLVRYAQFAPLQVLYILGGIQASASPGYFINF